MRSKSGFSLKTALGEAVRFVPRGVSAAWAALLLFWLAALASGLTFAPLTEMPGVKVGIMLALVVAGLMAEGALYRTALFGAYAKPEGLGWGGLQFSKPELRLIGAGLLVLVFMGFIAAFLSLVLALGLNMAGLMTPDMTLPHDLLRYHGKATIGVIAATCFIAIFLLYLSFRLSLYKAATVATHEIVSLNALSLSEGKAFKLFLGVFVLSLPVIGLVSLILGAFVHPVWGGGYIAYLPGNSFLISSDPSSKDFAGGAVIHLSLLGQGLLKALAIFLVMPAIVGFLSSAYRQTVELRATH